MNFDFLISIFFPPQCLRCAKGLARGALCDECRGEVPLAHSFFCGACRRPLAKSTSPGTAPPKDFDLLAGRSSCHPDFPYLLGAASRYHERTVTSLVRALKFHRVKAAAEPLASFIIQYLSSLDEDISGHLLIPIPLSKKRLRERGFNQADLIAREIAGHHHLPLDPAALARVKHSPPQSEASSLAERVAQLRGCFMVSDPRTIEGRHILLIDDVVTSGATFLEASRALRGAGAASVTAVAVAQG